MAVKSELWKSLFRLTFKGEKPIINHNKSIKMKYIYLILAICFEVAGTASIKYSNGFKNILATMLAGAFYVLSLGFLGLTLKYFEVGKAYAIWSGVGTALIAIIGCLIFKESVTLYKIIFITLIIIGVVGLQLAGNRG